MCVPNFIQIKQLSVKRASEEESGETKKPKFHEMLGLLFSRWQNLESKGAYEVETLHVLNQLFHFVCATIIQIQHFSG